MTEHAQAMSGPALPPPVQVVVEVSTQPTSAGFTVCCESFIETLNRTDSDELTKLQYPQLKEKYLRPADIESFLGYCHAWQQK